MTCSAIAYDTTVSSKLLEQSHVRVYSRTGSSRTKSFKCLIGLSSSVLNIDGCSSEYGTRFSAARSRIWGFGWARKPTSYGRHC